MIKPVTLAAGETISRLQAPVCPATPAAEAASTINKVTERLSQPSAVNGVRCGEAVNLPSVGELKEIMERLRAAIFPGYFGKHRFTPESMHYHLAASLDSIYQMMANQIVAGLCFACQCNGEPCQDSESEGKIRALEFIRSLPRIQKLLEGDARAAYEGDPAARSPGETIFCYPSINAMFHYRIAHELYRLKVPVIPRIISEMAHSSTGIDIHPGAEIGKDFFIDHGTGVVIGETCVIGNGCRLYQGVTLGALSFPKNEDGTLTKGIPRHPILEDDVTVYAGATILGRVTIGRGAVIGGNVWITDNVAPGITITQSCPRH